MSLGPSTIRAVDRAVELVNLHLVRRGEMTQRDLHGLFGDLGWEADQLDVDAFERLAVDLHEALRDMDPEGRIRRLNHLLDHLQPIPRLALHEDQGAYFRYGVTGTAAERVGATLVMAIANTLVDEGGDRFGWCEAPHCERLFFDRSRNRSQRFCSRSCATRVHVRAHRARQPDGT